MKLIPSSQKKRIMKILEETYGIKKIPHLLLRFGKDKVRAYSGSLSKEELLDLDNDLRVESVGLYFLHDYYDEIRLNLDALHILKDQITKNIFELNDQQAQDWFKGNDIFLETPTTKTFKVLKYKDNLIGCGKCTGTEIKNYMPKERRIKN